MEFQNLKSRLSKQPTPTYDALKRLNIAEQYELSQMDKSILLKDIEAAEAYGIADRTAVTKAFVMKYQDQGIDKIEHEN